MCACANCKGTGAIGLGQKYFSKGTPRVEESMSENLHLGKRCLIHNFQFFSVGHVYVVELGPSSRFVLNTTRFVLNTTRLPARIK